MNDPEFAAGVGPMVNRPFGSAHIKSLGAWTGTPSLLARCWANPFGKLPVSHDSNRIPCPLNSGFCSIRLAKTLWFTVLAPMTTDSGEPWTATSNIPSAGIAFEALNRNSSPAVPNWIQPSAANPPPPIASSERAELKMPAPPAAKSSIGTNIRATLAPAQIRWPKEAL